MTNDFWYGVSAGMWGMLALRWAATWPVWTRLKARITDKLDEWRDDGW